MNPELNAAYCLVAANWFYDHGYPQSSWYWLFIWANAKGEVA